jgi:DNA-directed RNA polymerase specialized sigma24 family protein
VTREEQQLAREMEDARPRLLGLARHLAGRDAEDLVQETMLKGWKGRNNRKIPTAYWLRIVLLGLHKDRIGYNARRPSVSLDELQDLVGDSCVHLRGPEPDWGLDELTERVLELAGPDASLLVARALGCTVGELSDAGWGTVASLKSRIFRAKSRLVKLA